MRIVSNYISIVILLIITFVLTYRYVNLINQIYDRSLVKLGENNRSCYSSIVVNNIKYTIIDLECTGEIIRVHGEYTVFINTSRFTILASDPSEELIIVFKEGFIIV